ncbi:MAG: hypothetical protein WDW38_007894 [Sanguina aurantia]
MTLQTIETVIVGGPEHGLVSHRPWESDDTLPLAQSCCDGRLCVAAARRHDDAGTRYLLLHPRATGEQFLTLLGV